MATCSQISVCINKYFYTRRARRSAVSSPALQIKVLTLVRAEHDKTLSSGSKKKVTVCGRSLRSVWASALAADGTMAKSWYVRNKPSYFSRRRQNAALYSNSTHGQRVHWYQFNILKRRAVHGGRQKGYVSKMGPRVPPDWKGPLWQRNEHRDDWIGLSVSRYTWSPCGGFLCISWKSFVVTPILRSLLLVQSVHVCFLFVLLCVCLCFFVIVFVCGYLGVTIFVYSYVYMDECGYVDMWVYWARRCSRDYCLLVYNTTACCTSANSMSVTS